MDSPQSLVLRRSARFDVALRARVSVAAEHAAFVKFSMGAVERQGGLMVDLVDLSLGGCGLLTGVFIPRSCLIEVRVLGPDGQEGEELVHARARVQRVIMTDRRPAYLIGTAFEDMREAQRERLERLVRQFGDGPSEARA